MFSSDGKEKSSIVPINSGLEHDSSPSFDREVNADLALLKMAEIKLGEVSSQSIKSKASLPDQLVDELDPSIGSLATQELDLTDGTTNDKVSRKIHLPQRKPIFSLIFYPLIVVLIIFACLIYLTEKGYLSWNLDRYYTSIGIQRLWYGLPYRASEALGLGITALTDQSDYDLTGNITTKIVATNVKTVEDYLSQYFKITNYSPTRSNQLLVPTATALEIDSQPVSFDISTELTAAVNTNKLSGQLHSTSGSLSNILDAIGLSDSSNNQFNIDASIVDQKLYSKVTTTKSLINYDSKWIRHSFDLATLAKYTDPTKINMLKAAIKTNERVGFVYLDGIETAKYRLVLDLSKMPSDVLSSLDITKTKDKYEPVEIFVWLKKTDWLIQKISLQVKSTSPEFQIVSSAEILFSGYGISNSKNIIVPDQFEADGYRSILEKYNQKVQSSSSNQTSQTQSADWIITS